MKVMLIHWISEYIVKGKSAKTSCRAAKLNFAVRKDIQVIVNIPDSSCQNLCLNCRFDAMDILDFINPG